MRVNSLAKRHEVANITMSERPAKRQRIELSLEKRVESIKYAESVPKPTLIALSGKFGIGKSTVGDILEKKECCECHTRLFFAYFTVYFPLATVFTDHVPIY